MRRRRPITLERQSYREPTVLGVRRIALAMIVLTSVAVVGATPDEGSAEATTTVPYVSDGGTLSIRQAEQWATVADNVWGVSPLSLRGQFFVEVSKPEVCAADQSGLIAVARLDASTGRRELFGDGGHPVLSWDGRYLAYVGIDCVTNADQRTFRLVVRDLIDGSEVSFPAPIDGSSTTSGSWVQPVAWDRDSRHVVLQVGTIGLPGISPEFWYVDALSEGPVLVGHRLAKLDHNRGPYGIAALGTTGKWAAVVAEDGGKGPVRVVKFDLETARAGRVLFRVPASGRHGAAALIRIIGDPSGEAMLVLIGSTNFSSSLYDVNTATREAELLQDGVVHAGWFVPPPS